MTGSLFICETSGSHSSTDHNYCSRMSTVTFLDYSHSQHESSTLTQEVEYPTNQHSMFKSFSHCI